MISNEEYDFASAPRSKGDDMETEIGLEISFHPETKHRRLTLFIPDGPSMQVTLSEDEAWVVAQSLCTEPKVS